MIIEVDINKLNKLNLSGNQYLLLYLLHQGNKRKIIKRYLKINENNGITKEELKNLIDRKYILNDTITDTGYDFDSIKVASLLKETNDISMFDELALLYPVKVTRPDGGTDYLKTNIKQCKTKYNNIIKNSRIKHDNIVKCLKFEIEEKTKTNSMKYMQRMLNWLKNESWKIYENKLDETPEKPKIGYGQNFL